LGSRRGKPYIALLNQVVVWNAPPLVLLCDAHDQAQVGIDEMLACCLVACLNALAKVNLLIPREQGNRS
jgi:hypothetical protein